MGGFGWWIWKGELTGVNAFYEMGCWIRFRKGKQTGCACCSTRGGAVVGVEGFYKGVAVGEGFGEEGEEGWEIGVFGGEDAVGRGWFGGGGGGGGHCIVEQVGLRMSWLFLYSLTEWCVVCGVWCMV